MISAQMTKPSMGDILEEIGRAVQDAMKHTPPQWTVITPDGRLLQGTQRDIAHVLLQNIDVAALFPDDKPAQAAGVAQKGGAE